MGKPRKKRGITNICAHCGKPYYVYPCRAGISKYCCRACHDAGSATSEQRELVCKRCGKKFVAKQDHGNWPVYCSRFCFQGEVRKPTEKVCPTCGKKFIASRSTSNKDGLTKYCSIECSQQGMLSGVEKVCVNCGEKFYLSKSTQEQRPKEGCCSEKCQYEYYVLEKNNQWKGGKYIDSGSGQIRRLCKREGAASDYLAEHRLIAARHIGRFLKRTEMMLHLNNKPRDNRPENLFICRSISEMRKRHNGTLPWPEESNLSTYK